MKLAPSHPDSLARRAWLGRCAALGACGASWPALAVAAVEGRLTRRIPSSGEALPVIGLGSWITFNVGNDSAARDACAEVVRAFFAGGGRVIDSSPMYGSAQPTIGHALARVGRPAGRFSAEKVWVGDGGRGPAQMEASRAFWGVPRFDLMQVHDLLAWQEHLPRLFEMKAAGRLRYVAYPARPAMGIGCQIAPCAQHQQHGRQHRQTQGQARRGPGDRLIAQPDETPGTERQPGSQCQTPVGARRSRSKTTSGYEVVLRYFVYLRASKAPVGARRSRRKKGVTARPLLSLPSRERVGGEAGVSSRMRRAR